MSGGIHYFCTDKHSYTLGIFAAFFAGELAEKIRIVSYRTLAAIEGFGPGCFIFTDFDRLTTEENRRFATLADALSAAGGRVLNHPLKSLGRFDLLRRLHDAGINDFNVYRLDDWREAHRFPVFVRSETVHGQMVTHLLPDRKWLEAVVEKMREDGNATPDMMVVEFGNARGEDGRYRKYAAFRVGDEIYAQHCYSGEDWRVKYASANLGEAQWREHDSFAAGNPHRDQLEKIFAIANIDYGRMDYGIVDGRVQVFEINTNPTIVHAKAAESMDPSHYIRQHHEALAALLGTGSGPGFTTNPLFSMPKRKIDVDTAHQRVMKLVHEHWKASGPGEPKATVSG